MSLYQRLFNNVRRWFTRQRKMGQSLFKTADDCSFYKRNKDIPIGKSPYAVLPSSVRCEGTVLIADILNNKNEVLLKLKVEILENNSLRFRIDHPDSILPRFKVQDVLVDEPKTIKINDYVITSDDETQVKYENITVLLKHKPFMLEILVDDKLVTSVNAQGLLNFEQYRKKPKINRGGMWEEDFRGHRDNKPRGPSSVGLDITFSDFDAVYGLSQHADSMCLKSTREKKDPYRLYNLDVYAYALDSHQGMYGSIPYMIAHSKSKTVGVFLMNASETWVDIDYHSEQDSVTKEVTAKRINTHWICESGIIDLFLFLGPRPHDVFKQYAALTGTTTLPPLFSLAYHQSRWSYLDEEDVLSVDENFDRYKIPYDVIWLDIEHTDGKRFFTWDKEKFPKPREMQEKIAAKGRKLVIIVNPHIKKDENYVIYKELFENGHFIRNHLNEVYEDKCWPETSLWVDFVHPKARDWWADKFHINGLSEATSSLHVWNDMNEPAVFEGGELTVPKDTLHFGDWEHRDVHNLYGFYNHMASYEGVKKRSDGTKRAFVLSRSFFAGSQRYGPIWTGDNKAEWGYLRISIPMILSMGLCAITFAGADVGGYSGNPDPELMIRWYQAGTYLPFFRAHSENTSDRREPWLFDETGMKLIRAAICERYILLPFWYTLFYENSKTGVPIVRPFWVEYPEEKATYTIDDAFLIGRDFLVKPITSPGQTHVDVHLPGKDEVWYTRDGGKIFRGGYSRKDVEVTLDMIPVYQRGGSIIPQKNTIRECSRNMDNDPYTLVIALDMAGRAEGQLYLDDGETFDYENGDYILKSFVYDEHILKSQCEHKSRSFETSSKLDALIIYGFLNPAKHICVNDIEIEKGCRWSNSTLTVHDLNLTMTDDWTIAFS